MNLGKIYGSMLNSVKVVEEKTLPKKQGPGAKELNDKDAAKLQDGGPTEKGGFKPAEIDPNKISKKEDEDNIYVGNTLTAEEDEEIVEKSSQRAINNFMSKSIFDKLYENVMSDSMNMGSEDAESMELDALGIEGDAGGDEMGGEEDTVTITLSKDLAKQLHDVLMGVIGEGETEMEDMGEEMGEEGGDEMDFESDSLEEDEEEMGHVLVNAKKPNMGEKGNNKVNMKLKPSSGNGGDGKYTDEVKGDAGDIGHALVNAKKPDMGEKGGNKVKGQTKTGKVGSDFFA